MRKSLKKALDKVCKKYETMTQEEFNREIEEHKNGDIARILIETGKAEMMVEEFKRMKKGRKRS